MIANNRLVYFRPRIRVCLSDIVWVEGVNNSSLIHFQDGSSRKVAITLSKVAGRLPELMRIHRGQLINLLHVQRLEREPNVLVLNSGERLPIARRRWPDVHRHYLQFRSIN